MLRASSTFFWHDSPLPVDHHCIGPLRPHLRATHCPVIASIAMQLHIISPGNSPPCSRLQLILQGTSSRRAPFRLRIIFPARFSSSLLPPRGSSTSSFTGASHLLSVSKPTHTPRFEPTAPPSFFACLRPPFSLIQSRPIIRSFHVSSACGLRELFPRVLITLFIDIRTFHTDTGTLIYSLLSCEFLHCIRLHIYHTDLHRIYYVMLLSGMLTHLCLVTCIRLW